MKKFLWYIFIIAFPIAVGAIIGVLLYHPLVNGYCIFRLDFVLNAIITFASTLSGFVLTSVSILIGLSSSPIMIKLQNDGNLAELRIRYTETLIIGVLVIVFCVVLGAKTDASNMITQRWAICGITFVISYFISILTTGYYLLKVIGLIPNKSGIQTENSPGTPDGKFRVDEQN